MNEIYKDIQSILAVSDIHPADCIKINNLIVELIKENQALKEKFKATNKGLQKVVLKRKKWKHRYQLAKCKIKELKKQLHEASIEMQEMIEQDIECPSNCSKLKEILNQQKEFIKYLEDKINYYKRNTQCFSMNLIEEILQKYKSIIGVSDENN